MFNSDEDFDLGQDSLINPWTDCDYCNGMGCEDCQDEDEDDTECLDSEDYDDSMDGDHESGLASAGWGTDESYGGGNDYDPWGE